MYSKWIKRKRPIIGWIFFGWRIILPSFLYRDRLCTRWNLVLLKRNERIICAVIVAAAYFPLFCRVSSAQRCLTSEFGMGSGVSTMPSHHYNWTHYHQHFYFVLIFDASHIFYNKNIWEAVCIILLLKLYGIKKFEWRKNYNKNMQKVWSSNNNTE